MMRYEWVIRSGDNYIDGGFNNAAFILWTWDQLNDLLTRPNIQFDIYPLPKDSPL